MFQLAISGERSAVESVWLESENRLLRFFIATLYYTPGGGEHERTTAFRPLPMNEVRDRDGLAERARELDLVAEHRSALAAELAALLTPYRKRLRDFDNALWNARRGDGKPITASCFDELSAHRP